MLRRDTFTLTALLGVLTAFQPMAMDIYAPTMPSIGRLFNASTADVQLTLSSYLVGYAVGQVVYGPLSDRLGRKPALLLALALFCAASLACAASPGIATLIVSRGLQALGAAGVVLLPRAIVRDLLQDLYGLSPFAFSIAYAVACGGAVAGGSITAALAMRIGLDRTMALGVLCLAGGGLAMTACLALGLPPVASLVLPMVICHAGNMLATPPAVAGALTPFPHCAGTASSLAGLVQQLAAALAGTMVGHTLGHSAWPLAIAIAATGCGSLVMWAASRRIRTADRMSAQAGRNQGETVG